MGRTPPWDPQSRLGAGCRQACPGAPNRTCSTHGFCIAKVYGTGRCFCDDGYAGADCSAWGPAVPPRLARVPGCSRCLVCLGGRPGGTVLTPPSRTEFWGVLGVLAMATEESKPNSQHKLWITERTKGTGAHLPEKSLPTLHKHNVANSCLTSFPRSFLPPPLQPTRRPIFGLLPELRSEIFALFLSGFAHFGLFFFTRIFVHFLCIFPLFF